MYDTIIIGGGPGGIGCAVYTVRYKLKTLLISKDIGGLMLKSHRIENYPGFKTVTGEELSKKFGDHIKDLGTEILIDEVVNIKKDSDGFVVDCLNKKGVKGKTILLAMGTQSRKLNIPGEEAYLGKGVSYCATCDAPLFKNKIVGVVGGSDSAAVTAIFVAEYAKKVYIIYRQDKLRAEPINVEKIEKNKKIEVITNANISEILGNKFVEKIRLNTGKILELSGLFIEAGSTPLPALAKGLGVKLTENSYIIVNEKKETNVEGIYAAGDITNTPMRQIITAGADGAIAANSAYLYLRNKKG